MRLTRRPAHPVRTGVLFAAGAAIVSGGLLLGSHLSGGPAKIEARPAFALLGCHDDSDNTKTNTHGSPLNGSFGQPGAPPNHSEGYYYLNVQSTGACPVGADGLYHFVLHITANGTGLLPGCTPSSNWGPPCDPSFRKVVGAELHAQTDVQWGLETKNGDRSQTLACSGGDGAGGYPSLCPNSPNVVAPCGDCMIEWRYDGPQSAISQRIDNQYDDPIWETATLDVVACSTCEPGATTPTPTPAPTPSSASITCTLTITDGTVTGKCG